MRVVAYLNGRFENNVLVYSLAQGPYLGTTRRGSQGQQAPRVWISKVPRKISIILGWDTWELTIVFSPHLVRQGGLNLGRR